MIKKNIFMLSLLVVGGLLFSACLPQKEADKVVEEPKETMMITIAEVEEHATKDDCWMAIDGKVYDLTKYIASATHPGGPAMAKDCGTDATFVYQNDPEHSEYATSLLPPFYIGELTSSETSSE